VSGRRPARALLLDLDGTLLDTAPDMGAALNALRAEHGREPLPYGAIRAQVSHGSPALVRLGFPGVATAEHERLRRRFLELYHQMLSVGTKIFPGFESVLASLEAGGVPWGIVTNKPGWLTAPLLVALGLERRAGCVVAGDTLPLRKPRPEPLWHGAALIEVAPDACVYVGDTERDVIAGRAAGMGTVAVRYGYRAEDDDPATWLPDGVVDAPAELLDWVDLRR
jgi:phosphoglycolate phosphatase